MRKFIFSGSVISAVFGVVSVAKTTKEGPRDWRLVLMWISWGCAVAIAVGTAIERSNDVKEIKN